MLFFQWGCNPPLLLQSSSPTRFPEFSLMVGSKHLHLHWPVAGRTSPGTATLGSCLQVPLDHSNSVGFSVYRQDRSPGGAVSHLAIPSVSVPIFVPVLPLDRNISGLKNLEMVGWPHPTTRGCAYLLPLSPNLLCKFPQHIQCILCLCDYFLLCLSLFHACSQLLTLERLRCLSRLDVKSTPHTAFLMPSSKTARVWK